MHRHWHHAHGHRAFHPGMVERFKRRSRSLSLRRRLFWFIGVTVLLTLAVAGAVTHFVSGLRPSLEQAPAFLSAEFERVWHAPAERLRLARSLSETMRMRVELRDASGTVVDRVGGECKNPFSEIEVATGGTTEGLGTVTLCAQGDHDRRALLLLLLGSAGLTVWLLAGILARKLTWPLVELTAVTQRLGEGDLKSRVRLALHAPGEAGTLAHSINRMGARIERQMEEQRELLGAVSHEIRSPLARLRVLTELLRDERGGSGRVDDIEREIAELDALTGKLLAKSRLDFDSVSFSEVDLVEVASREMERAGLSPALLNAPSSRFVVPGDATLLSRALANLLENAEHHGAGVTRVTLSVDGDLAWLCVHDRGEGLTDQDARPSSGRGDARIPRAGLGLGLSLVRRIARAHGGSVKSGRSDEGGAAVGFSVRRIPSTG